MDSLQRRLFAMAAGVFRYPLESVVDFKRRAARVSRKYCEEAGWWSRIWFTTAVKWDLHLLRDFDRQRPFWDGDGVNASDVKSAWSWAPLLRRHHDSAWLSDRTTTVVRSAARGTTTTRTGLRGVRGFVAPRWQAGVAMAENMTL